jgi:hypothetical protein
MSKVVSGTLPQPTRPHDAVRALLWAGKNDEAIVQLCAITITRPDDLTARELLFDVFYQKPDWAPALVLAEQLAQQQPGVARLEKALIARYLAAVTKSYSNRYKEPQKYEKWSRKSVAASVLGVTLVRMISIFAEPWFSSAPVLLAYMMVSAPL